MTAPAPSASFEEDRTVLRDILRDIGGFIRHLIDKLREDRCQQSAAALTYVTLFALVPMITVFYTILSAFPMFESAGTQIQKLIFENFVASTSEDIFDYLVTFSDKARNLTFAGTVMLIVSAYLMLKNIENSFNQIWRVKQGRSGLANFLLYWAVLSLGPLLLGAGIIISTYLFSLSIFSDNQQTSHILLGLLPIALNFGTFTLIYAAVPNCRVPLRHAALGGILTTALFGAVKNLFAWSAGLGSYQLIYGAFAALPLFLLWIYISWLLLLFGAEFVNALSSWRGERSAYQPDLMIALAVLEKAWRRLQNGQTLAESELLSRGWLLGTETISSARWQQVRERLLSHNLLRVTENGTLVPGSDAASTTLWDLLSALSTHESLELPDNPNFPHWFRHTATQMGDTETNLRSGLSTTLLELFDYQGAHSNHANTAQPSD